MRKKLFAILMSAMMMVTFMPTMAFATEGQEKDDCNYVIETSTADWSAYTTLTDKEKESVTDVVAPTHEKTGSLVVHCRSYNCDETMEVTINALGHDWDGTTDTSIAKFMTIQAYADAMVAQKEKNKYQAANYVKEHKADCGVNVKVCSCGEVYFVSLDSTHSDAPANVKHYVCAECGKTVTVAGHTHTTDVKTTTKPVAKTCSHKSGYMQICDVCKEEYFDVTTAAETLYAHTWANRATDMKHNGHNWTGSAVNVLEGNVSELKAGYVAVMTDGQAAPEGYKLDDDPALTFHKYSKIVPGTNGGVCSQGNYVWLCAVCGGEEDAEVLEERAVASATDYCDYEVVEHVAATCENDGYDKLVCKVCGKENTKPYATTEKKLAHTYVVKHVEATCALDEEYIITCSTCGKDCTDKTHKTGVKVTRPAGDDTKASEAPFYGFDEELKDTSKVMWLQFAPKTATKHVYGAKELLKPATCTENELWGYKCTVCGKVATHAVKNFKPEYKANTMVAHAVKTVVEPATCGKGGSSFNVCTVCGNYLTKAGEYSKNKVEFDTTLPVVATGVACDFTGAWKTVKAATIFEEGVKAITCAKCGAVDMTTKAVIAKLSYAAPKVKAAKKAVKVTVADKGADTYKIYVNGKLKKTVTAAGTYTIKKLKKGSKAKVKLVATNAAGLKATSKVKTVKVK